MEKALVTLAIIIVVAIFVTGFWWLFFWLWGVIAVGVFSLPALTFWQSVGLLVLVGMLTGGFRNKRN